MPDALTADERLERTIRSLHTLDELGLPYGIEQPLLELLGRVRALEAEARYLRERDRFPFGFLRRERQRPR